MDGRKEIAIVNLPKLQPGESVEQNAIARRLADKIHDLRLHALAVAPNDFASTYEVEVTQGLEQTLGRLKNSQADHYCAVRSGVNISEADKDEGCFHELLEARWIGMVVLIGPLEGQSSGSAASDPLRQQTARTCTSEPELQVASENPRLRYHLNGLFVEPTTRRHGVGMALIEAALDKARVRCLKQRASLLCGVLVDSENLAARRLYEKAGFVAVGGEEPYVQMRRSKTGALEGSERVAVRMEIR